MIKIEKVNVYGTEEAIRGMRNPLNSWDKSDSFYDNDLGLYVIGPNDLNLMHKLAKGGPVHAKYRRMLTVYADITAPLYWWKEFDTYKVGTVANSCSTMHTIHKRYFNVNDFSHEHLFSTKILEVTIHELNFWRDIYLNGGTHPSVKEITNFEPKDKRAWWQLIQLLPSSYNQKRTVMLNYEVLHNIFYSRKDHKLDEWNVLCDWIKTLPYAEGVIYE